MEIISVADKRFKKYGKVIKNIDFSSLVEEMKKTEVPEGVVYEPSVEQLESLEARGGKASNYHVQRSGTYRL